MLNPFPDWGRIFKILVLFPCDLLGLPHDTILTMRAIEPQDTGIGAEHVTEG